MSELLELMLRVAVLTLCAVAFIWFVIYVIRSFVTLLKDVAKLARDLWTAFSDPQSLLPPPS